MDNFLTWNLWKKYFLEHVLDDGEKGLKWLAITSGDSPLVFLKSKTRDCQIAYLGIVLIDIFAKRDKEFANWTLWTILINVLNNRSVIDSN